MYIKYFKFSIYFTLLFILLSVVLVNYQLLGVNDSAIYLGAIYNFFSDGFVGSYYECELAKNYLGSHFSPFWILFSPLLFIFKEPIALLYFMNYIGYLFWFLTSIYVIEKSWSIEFDFLKILKFFGLFFISITVLFNYFLNYNGIHEVLFAIGFLNIAIFYLLIKEDYFKAFLWYLPTLAIKEEFWLLFIFFNFIIFLKSRQKLYLISTLLSFIAFGFLYFKLMPYILATEIYHHSNYSYLFKAKSLGELFEAILSLPAIPQKLFQIFAFFIPLIFLIDFKKIKLIDWVILTILIWPTIGYDFLTPHIGQSNFLFDHYSMPIISAIFIAIVKYSSLTKVRVSLYIATNILLIAFVLYVKEPWQYKYYLDEDKLKKEVMPLLKLTNQDKVIVEERTGIYFSFYKSDYMRYLYNCKYNQSSKYIIFNLRYSYNSQNLKFIPPVSPNTSFNYINSFNDKLKNYGIIYLNYPFIIYAKDNDSNLTFTKEMLDEWDKKTVEVNRWF